MTATGRCAPAARRRGVPRVVVAALLCLVLGSCGVTIDRRVLSGGSRGVPAGNADVVAVANIQAFWADQLPQLYRRPFRPVAPSRIRGLSPGETTTARCQGSRFTYGDVQGNAFAANCPEGSVVVWDDARLFPRLAQQFGPASGAVVLAHEWGHVAQFQAGVRLPTVYAEQQADCFAGAWMAALVANPPEQLSDLTSREGLDGALGTVISVRDPVGTDPRQEQAHGSGFDRVRAFQDGYDRGAQLCAGYSKNPPTLVEVPFSSLEEQQSGGNLQLSQLVGLVTPDLDSFFTGLVPGLSPRGRVTLADLDSGEQALLQELSRLGDSAPATALALQWAREAQSAAGAETEGAQGALQRSCLAGGWLNTLLAPAAGKRDLTLSPGDLDESILGLIALAGGQGTDVSGTDASTFELVSTFRQGVVQGAGSCGLGA